MDKLEALKDELKATEAKLEDLQTKIKELESPFNFQFGAILVNNLGHIRIYPYDSENVSLFSEGNAICTGSRPKDRANEYKEAGYKQLTISQARKVFEFIGSLYNEN